MDDDRYATVLVSRCAFLVSYHHRPARERSDKAELFFELGWLAADARRWGVPDRAIASGVLAELVRRYDRETARELIGEFMEAFGTMPESALVPA
jgi:hypothetical protein